MKERKKRREEKKLSTITGCKVRTPSALQHQKVGKIPTSNGMDQQILEFLQE